MRESLNNIGETNPIEAQYALIGDIEIKDVFSLLFFWAAQGYITIIEKDTSVVFNKEKELNISAKDYERILFNAIFYEYSDGTGTAVSSNELSGKLFNIIAKTSTGVKKEFNKKDRVSIIKRNIKLSVVTFLSSVPYMFLMLYIVNGLNSGNIATPGIVVSILTGSFFALPNSFYSYTVKKWLVSGSELNIGNTVWSSLLLFSLTAIMGGLANMSNIGFINAIIASLVSLTMSFFLGVIRKSMNHKHKLYMDVYELRRFMVDIKKDDIQEHLSNGYSCFYNNLPYAIVFGISKTWGEKFRGLVSSPPQWFQGYNKTPFDPSEFGQHLESLLKDWGKELSPNPTPSGNIASATF